MGFIYSAVFGATFHSANHRHKRSLQKPIERFVVLGIIVIIASGLFLVGETPAQEPTASGGAIEQGSLAQTGAIGRKSDGDLRLDHLVAEVDRLKQESTALRQAKVAAEARLSEQTRAHREQGELMAVIQQELFRAMDEIERLNKHGAALAEKAAARERERTAALRRELLASQREVQHLRAGHAKQAQIGSDVRGTDTTFTNGSVTSPRDLHQIDR
jgi:hypothetical protein